MKEKGIFEQWKEWQIWILLIAAISLIILLGYYLISKLSVEYCIGITIVLNLVVSCYLAIEKY